MLEQIYRFSRGNERVIEKVILDENLHYLHMVLNQGEGRSIIPMEMSI